MTATTELRLRRPHGETSCKSAVFSPPPPLPSPPSAAAPHRRRLLHEDGQHEKSRRGGPTHDGRGALSRRDRRALSGKLWFRHRDREGRAPARRHPSDQAARLPSRRLRRSRARHAHVVAPRGDAAADLDQVRRPQRQEDPPPTPTGAAASCTPARPSRRCSQAAGSARTSRSTGPCARRTQRSGKRLSLTPETQSRTGIRHGED